MILQLAVEIWQRGGPSRRKASRTERGGRLFPTPPPASGREWVRPPWTEVPPAPPGSQTRGCGEPRPAHVARGPGGGLPPAGACRAGGQAAGGQPRRRRGTLRRAQAEAAG